MNTNRQGGYVSGVLIALIFVSFFLVAALGFGGWAFMSRLDYKNNSDQKAEAAADKRQAETEAADAVKYAEEAKNPLATHKGPDQFGSIVVKYPKTWSGYVVETGKGATPVDDYFHPKVVPEAGDKDNSFALRVQVLDKTYDAVLKSYQGAVDKGRLKASPYALPKVENVIGTRLRGEVERKKQGTLVILPLRNMTLAIWSESPNYQADFNKIILPNLSFSP